MQDGIPEGAEVTVHSVRWVIQSRANENDLWHTENDTTPGLREGGFEGIARRLLGIYRGFAGDRESRLVLRTVASYDEPMEG